MTKIPFNISASKNGEKALIRITGTIGLDIQADLFRSQIDTLVNDGIMDAHLYINSPGGSVFDASEIVNIIRSAFKGQITGEGGALVASAATYIALHCKSFMMPENGMFMIHKPSGGAAGDAKDIESYLNLLQKIESQYFDIYKQRAKDIKALETMWSGGDWWMTAQEAQENGFITGITGKMEIDNQTNALIAACGCPDNKLPKKVGVELTAIAETLGLAANCTSDDVLEAIAILKGEESPEKAVKSALKTGCIKAFEQNEFLTIAKINPKTFSQLIHKRKEQAKIEQSKQIEGLLNAAIYEKRFVATAKDIWKKLLESDFETANAAIQQIEPLQKAKYNTGSSSGNRSNWSLDDWRKNDPRALEKSPDLYDDLLKKEVNN